MTEKKKRVKVSMSIEILSKIVECQKPNQTLSQICEELLREGLSNCKVGKKTEIEAKP